MIGKTTSWGDQIIEEAWPWVLNCEMRKHVTSEPCRLDGLSTLWGNQGVSALHDGTDETTMQVETGPSSLASLSLWALARWGWF